MKKQSLAISALVAFAQAASLPNQNERRLSVADTLEYPGDNCCHLFANHLWEDGVQVKICRDTHNTTDAKQLFDMHDYGINDAVSSWYCGKNVAYDFCRNGPNTNCDAGEGNRGAGNIKSSYIEKNDSMTAVYLSEYDPLV